MSCAACAYCGTETPRAQMTDTQFGLTCTKCMRMAQAEVMRARDEHAAFGRLETALMSVDLGPLIRSQEDAYDRVTQTEYTIRELLWLVRWQTRELAHAGRELASTREQLDDANAQQFRTVKGGQA